MKIDALAALCLGAILPVASGGYIRHGVARDDRVLEPGPKFDMASCMRSCNTASAKDNCKKRCKVEMCMFQYYGPSDDGDDGSRRLSEDGDDDSDDWKRLGTCQHQSASSEGEVRDCCCELFDPDLESNACDESRGACGKNNDEDWCRCFDDVECSCDNSGDGWEQGEPHPITCNAYSMSSKKYDIPCKPYPHQGADPYKVYCGWCLDCMNDDFFGWENWGHTCPDPCEVGANCDYHLLECSGD